VTPSVVTGSSVTRQPVGAIDGSCASSMARISSGPSSVVMFQVNATRSRQ
jgi:hypothetical protein